MVTVLLLVVVPVVVVAANYCLVGGLVYVGKSVDSFP